MHYRWSYGEGRRYASDVLAKEMASGIPLPLLARRLIVARRQRRGFVQGDGVDEATRNHVEQGYLTALDRMEAVLAGRRFLLGDAPSIADFGLMGPMFRHFSMDPPPAEIMRSRAPGVYAWVARMWNAKAGAQSPRFIEQVDEPVTQLLREACETHLVQLRANALAHAAGRSRYEQTVQDCRYTRLPVSRYRVWCLERLRCEWAALDEPVQTALRRILPEAFASVLWAAEVPLESGYDPDERAPFNRAINVFGTGVPR